MQVLEDVKEGPLACERSDDVVDDDEHRALPFVGIARGLGRPGKMEELRKGRGDELRRGEVEVAQLLGELRRSIGIVRIDLQFDEERLDEPRVAPLVPSREGPPEAPRRVAADAVLSRRREADELGEK